MAELISLLKGLDDKEFQSVVVDDLRSKLEPEWRAALASPTVAPRWYLVLDGFVGPDAGAADTAKRQALTALGALTAAEAAELDYNEFRVLVEADTKGRGTAALRAILREPTVVTRWFDALVAMQKTVEGTIASKQRDFVATVSDLELKRLEARTDRERYSFNRDIRREHGRHARWKAGAVRFKTGLDQRLVEARRLLHDLPLDGKIANLTNERNHALGRAYQLEEAIRHHRDATAAENEPSDADTQLWSYVSRPATPIGAS